MTQSISILCFGNSLTAGFHMYGLEYHPYALKLEELLKATFPSHTIRIDVDGLPGDLVISPPGNFQSRLQAKCAGASYDWVIVLGATNDLGHGYPCDRIIPALEDAWKTALASGANVLALTVPECAAVNKRLNANRDELNSHILGYQSANFYSFDLHSKLPYHGATEEFQETIWDDGLHLTAKGYDFLGELIANHLLQLLGPTKNEDGQVEEKN